MKTSELTGAALDYWVARAEGLQVDPFADNGERWFGIYDDAAPGGIWWIGGPDLREDDFYYTSAQRAYAPSTDWSKGGLLVSKYKLSLTEAKGTWFVGAGAVFLTRGDTPLQAICRAVVRAAFGDEVEEVLS